MGLFGSGFRVSILVTQKRRQEIHFLKIVEVRGHRESSHPSQDFPYPIVPSHLNIFISKEKTKTLLS